MEREKNREWLLECENLPQAASSNMELSAGDLRYTPKSYVIHESDEALPERSVICTVLFGRNLYFVAAGSCQGHLVLPGHKIDLKRTEFSLQK